MRKRTINCIFDNLLWYGVYLLPLLALLLVLVRTGNLITISGLLQNLGIEIFSSGVLFDTLNSIFGASGVVPLFVGTDILIYLTYFVSCVLLHLCVDFLLFIPRIADYFLNKLYGKGGE